MLKIGINDGCANGGMMDSLSIDKLSGDPDEDGDPFFVTEVTEKQWADWEAFLEEHDKWESFWDKKILAYEKSKGRKDV